MSYDVIKPFAEEILAGTPRSVRTVFTLLKQAGKPLRVNELQELTRLTDRTVRLALARLYKLDLVVKVPDLTDLRSHFLCLSPDIIASA